MSPTPGRSTLITSAPNQASNWVQVGPDWTWLKSRMRTPVSALVIWSLLSSLCCRHARESGLPCTGNDGDGLPVYFFFSTLCGLRLPIRPLSEPAAGSIRSEEHTSEL